MNRAVAAAVGHRLAWFVVSRFLPRILEALATMVFVILLGGPQWAAAGFAMAVYWCGDWSEAPRGGA